MKNELDLEYLLEVRRGFRLDARVFSLIAAHRLVVPRRRDVRLANDLESDLNQVKPYLRTSTICMLAKWCNTDEIYVRGMPIARKIALILFGQIPDRERLGVS